MEVGLLVSGRVYFLTWIKNILEGFPSNQPPFGADQPPGTVEMKFALSNINSFLDGVCFQKYWN